MQRTDTRRLGGRALAGLLAALVWLGSCRAERDPIPPLSDEQAGRDFLPVKPGLFWVYDVEEKEWQFNVPTPTRFQFRERVDTIYQGADGQLTYRIIRSRRPDSAAPWRDDSVMALVVAPQYIRRTFANTPTLELVFPVFEGKNWNPSILSSDEPATRYYEALDQPLELPSGERFARTVRVVDEGEDNLFRLRKLASAYARGVGLIRRDRQIYDFCDYNDSLQTGCPNGTGTYIVRGFERHEWLREFGTR